MADEVYDINLVSEELIAISGDLPRFVQGLVGGKRIHKSTAYRWALRGVRGRRLPTVRVAHRLFTSPGAFSWWAARLADDLLGAGESLEEGERAPDQAGVEDVLRRAGIRA